MSDEPNKETHLFDAHGRIAVLFEDEEMGINYAISVKWILAHGNPVNPESKEPMKYIGTFIVQ